MAEMYYRSRNSNREVTDKTTRVKTPLPTAISTTEIHKHPTFVRGTKTEPQRTEREVLSSMRASHRTDAESKWRWTAGSEAATSVSRALRNCINNRLRWDPCKKMDDKEQKRQTVSKYPTHNEKKVNSRVSGAPSLLFNRSFLSSFLL